jgi:RNA polymerase sigma-70 factor (ECF subfamily)
MTAATADFTSELERFIPNLRRYAARLNRDRSAADDLVQDCLVLALTKSHLFRNGSNMRAWLFTLMHNHSVNQIRRSTRREIYAGHDLGALAPSVAPSQETTVEFNEFAQVFGKLSRDKQQAVWLIGVEGMSYDEAAEKLRVPTGTVRSRLSRTRQALRDLDAA